MICRRVSDWWRAFGAIVNRNTRPFAGQTMGLPLSLTMDRNQAAFRCAFARIASNFFLPSGLCVQCSVLFLPTPLGALEAGCPFLAAACRFFLAMGSFSLLLATWPCAWECLIHLESISALTHSPTAAPANESGVNEVSCLLRRFSGRSRRAGFVYRIEISRSRKPFSTHREIQPKREK